MCCAIIVQGIKALGSGSRNTQVAGARSCEYEQRPNNLNKNRLSDGFIKGIVSIWICSFGAKGIYGMG